jgi:FAD synthase
MYGRPLALDLIARVRAEQRFASIEALVKQIQMDVATVEQLLAV